MKKSLLLWLALMASTSALAEGGKEIRFGVDPTFAPFEWKDPQGKLAGFDIDLGNAICQQLQAKCVWVESNFDGIIPALKARKFDAILSGMYMTEKRKAQIAFSDKLYNGPVFLVARKNTLQGNTPEQLKGKTIGVEQGSAQETYVNQHWRPQGINIVAYQGADSVVRDLESGRIDGAVLSGMMADYSFLQQPQGKEFAFVGGHLQDDTLFGAGAALALQRISQRGGHLGAEIEPVVRAAGFQQQDGGVWIFSQSCCQNVAGGAGTNNDVVKLQKNLPVKIWTGIYPSQPGWTSPGCNSAASSRRSRGQCRSVCSRQPAFPPGIPPSC